MLDSFYRGYSCMRYDSAQDHSELQSGEVVTVLSLESPKG